MRHHYFTSVIVHQRVCPIYDPAGKKKIRKRQETFFRKRQIPIRKRQPDLILFAPPASRLLVARRLLSTLRHAPLVSPSGYHSSSFPQWRGSV
eukprot:8838368-Pyramimonas_sp.AAC.3